MVGAITRVVIGATPARLAGGRLALGAQVQGARMVTGQMGLAQIENYIEDPRSADDVNSALWLFARSEERCEERGLALDGPPRNVV